ncbi:hypothetical protein E8E14_013954 [Neopestalotiopsis sp. 37M]|nr:hypothetical protein E8E14_013954 [Neopestalotiopsis sp. 37M]
MSPANEIPASGAEVPRPTPESYQDKNETNDSKLKAVWDSEMGAQEEKYSAYEKASVLLLSWHKDDDDLATAEEVSHGVHIPRAIEAKAASQESNEEPSQDLLLRFGFTDINDQTIRGMAKFLREAIRCNEITAKTISWEGIDMPAVSPLSIQEIMTARPGLMIFQNKLNKLRQLQNGIDKVQKVLQSKAPKAITVEGPISPGSSLDGSFNATPDRRLSAEPESGIRQGGPAYVNTPLIQIVKTPSIGGSQQATDTPILATPKGSKRSHDEDAEVPLLTTPNKRSRSEK